MVCNLKSLLRLDTIEADSERQRVTQLCQLLDQCLQLDPAQRLSAEDALEYPFFQTPVSGSTGRISKLEGKR